MGYDNVVSCLKQPLLELVTEKVRSWNVVSAETPTPRLTFLSSRLHSMLFPSLLYIPRTANAIFKPSGSVIPTLHLCVAVSALSAMDAGMIGHVARAGTQAPGFSVRPSTVHCFYHLSMSFGNM